MQTRKVESQNSSQNQDNESPRTQWHSICTSKCILLDGTSRFFCRHWEFHLGVPIFALILLLFCFIVFFVANFWYFELKFKIISSIEVCLFFILFLCSYFNSMCMDPGFLPYNWPVIPPSQRKFLYSWQYQLTYLATTPEQFEIAYREPIKENEANANDSNVSVNIESEDHEDPSDQPHSKSHYKNHSKLPFASFSKSSGRFVIRADHICGWIANWVGKRNHKQFILMLLYGSLFSASLFGWRFARKTSIKNKSFGLYFCEIFACVIECFFAFMLMGNCITYVVELSNGRTKLQNMKNNEEKDSKTANSSIDAMREVCGYGSIICWICPVPAFGEDLFIDPNV